MQCKKQNENCPSGSHLTTKYANPINPIIRYKKNIFMGLYPNWPN